MPLISFQRMRDEVDNLESQVVTKFPRLGRTGCLAIFATVVFVIFVLGLAIGYGIHSDRKSRPGGGSSISQAAPSYVFISNNSQSCPPLVAEYLLTTVGHGQSFEGLVVNLACKGNNMPFPTSVKCRRKNAFDEQSSVEWSHLPVCYPNMLIAKHHWEITPNARSVTCTGDSSSTQCKMSCIRDYIAVESSPYTCTKPPCRKWELQDSHCFMCDQKCSELGDPHDPNPRDLIKILGCKCDQIMVTSDGNAAIWQNKRTGLFFFYGEHNGRPVYRNKATKEYLFFTLSGSQWLVGPDFRKPHAGIQVLGNDNTQCPENHGGKNVSRLYIDSSEPSPGGTGKWTPDDTLSFECVSDTFKPVTCGCKRYKVFNLAYEDGKVPEAVSYLAGEFEIDTEQQNSKGLMAPLYFNKEKDLYLFSHHPKGLVWQVSTKLSMTPLRGIQNASEKPKACPDSNTLTWEWFNSTTSQGQQIYVKDDHIQIKCLDKF